MLIRPYYKSDARQLNTVAVEAFRQFQNQYNDWNAIQSVVGNMSALEGSSELIIAEDKGKVMGGVAFVPPKIDPKGYFDPTWATIRMLVVSPAGRGKGIGRKLTEACLKKAKENDIKIIGLHTSPIMEVALSMYLRMGFVKIKDIDPIYGVEYAVYKLAL